MNDQYAWLVGLDWADQKHDLAIGEKEGTERHVEIGSSPEDVEQWLALEREKRPGGRFAVCLEQSKGALFYMLSKYDFIDLYPVNPAALANYRKAFATSGAKSDARDAALMLDLLVRHPENLRKVDPDSVAMRKLAGLCEGRRKCVDERTRHANALKSLLKILFPQALGLCGEKLYGALSLDFLERWATLKEFQRARAGTIAAFYEKHHGGRKRVERAIDVRERGLCAIEDPAIVEPAALNLAALLERLRAANSAINRYDDAIAVTSTETDEVALFASFPGAGKALAPRMAAAFGSRRERWSSSSEAQTYFGIAPVTESSGKSHYVHWRWSCPKFLRQTFVEYAKESRRKSAWARAYYDHARQHGKTHNKALRALAWKWLRILWRCWQSGEPYDEEYYIAALEKNGSWLAQQCQEN